MQKESTAILLRIFIGESDKYQGMNLYQYLVQYLRKNHFSGVTVLRGITGFGRASKIHTSDLLELSSDLPIVIEIVDNEEKIEELKKVFDQTGMIGSALITEEKVKIVQYGAGKS
jgi:PII-like signaling protein